jgi:hypothetical protein
MPRPAGTLGSHCEAPGRFDAIGRVTRPCNRHRPGCQSALYFVYLRADNSAMSHLPSHHDDEPETVEQKALERRIEGLDGSHAAAPQLGFLLAGAQWRDSWLHAFRSLYLVMEVILLGLAGGLLIAILTLEVSRAWVPAVLLIVDAACSLLLLSRMRRAAINLGDDVRFWHREIIRAEREIPPERRVFTRFKLLQRSRNYSDTDEIMTQALSPNGLDEAGLDHLIERFSPTRQLIESRVPMLIAILWVSWSIAGVGALMLRMTHIIG